MKYFIYLFLLLYAPLLAEESEPYYPDAKTLALPDVEERGVFSIKSHQKITSNVDVVTGEYLEEDCDLVLAGSEPLSVRRYYGSHGTYHPTYNVWRFNPEHFCVANFAMPTDERFVAFGRENGSMICLDESHPQGLYTFNQLRRKNSLNYGMSGQTHPANCHVTYAADRQKKEFCWIGEIKEGDGTKKKFLSAKFGWLHKLLRYENPKSRTGPYYLSPEAWTPYQIPVIEERKPNGNIICYTYEDAFFDRKIPGHLRIKSITAYNSTKTKILNTLNFHYKTGKGQKQKLFIEGSDKRVASYIYLQTKLYEDVEGDYLGCVAASGKQTIRYTHDSGGKQEQQRGKKLKCVCRGENRKVDNRILTTNYDYKKNRVINQYAPIGPHGEQALLAGYNYHKNFTEAFDAEGNKTIYRFDTEGRIHDVELYDKKSNKPFKIEHLTWNCKNGELHDKTISNQDNSSYCYEQYNYDARHNVIEKTISDGKDKYILRRTYSDDGFNLLLSETDDYGKDIRYTYVPNTNLLASELIYDNNHIRKRKYLFYDDCAIAIKTIEDDGKSIDPNDLQGVTYRRITYVKPRYEHPCFGLPEEIEEKSCDAEGKEILLSRVKLRYAPFGKILQEDHYDDKNKFLYSIYNEYDDRERLSQNIDPLGIKTSYTYDDNNNILSITRGDVKKEFAYDAADRLISEKDQEGVVIKRTYDLLSRLTSLTNEFGSMTRFEYDVLGNVNKTIYPDGTFETKEYDALGRLIKEVDPKGDVTNRGYNFLNLLTSCIYPDGSSESYTYRPDGQLLVHVDRQGATHQYTRDIFGNILKEVILSSQGEHFKTLENTFTPFVQLTTSDGEGVTTFFTYDFAGRKIGEEIAYMRTSFEYDPLGRMWRKECGGIFYIEERDFLNRVIAQRKENSHGDLLLEEKYVYDALGNKTQVITPYGVSEMTYNKRGEITSQKDPLGNVTKILHTYGDKASKTEINPHGCSNTIYYDSLGREKEKHFKNCAGEVLHKSLYAYDKNGNMIEEKECVYEGTLWKRDVITFYKYGPCNRLEALVEDGSKTTSYLFDNQGRMYGVVKPNGLILYHTYDDLGRLTHHASQDFDYNYNYDKCDRIVKVEDKVAKTITQRSYDALGNILKETLANGLEISNHYNSLGQREKMVLPDKSFVLFKYKDDFLHKIERKEFTYLYEKRDLMGYATKMALCGGAGVLEVERDAMSRVKKIVSPSFSAEYTYDALGHMNDYIAIDAQGRMSGRFSYDDLEQITEENEHTYAHDSLNNRVKKDETSFSINGLSQIEDPNFQYDANGNLLTDGKRTFEYDTQDRLVAIIQGKKVVRYTYDAFNRRLSKTGENIVHYLWDEQNEIGSTDKKLKIKELRILGEGLGAEIGAAILMELQGKTYVPVHDHRGCVVALLDLNSKKKSEMYRYTAFGEETTKGVLSPWRFSSKRVDPESGFVYFGRRYYWPEKGRWLTPDPKGFEDGPNLYAYVRNNPITNTDLYGLRINGRNGGIFNELYRWASSRTRQHHHHHHHPRVQRCIHHAGASLENLCANKSKTVVVGEQPLAHNKRVMFGNGMRNSLDQALKSAKLISEAAGGAQIFLNYNPNHTFLAEGAEAILGYCGILSASAIQLRETWKRELDLMGPTGTILDWCHSEGAINVRNALRHTPKDLRDRIHVRAIAPAVYIDKNLCGSVKHFVSRGDVIPWLDPIGRFKHRDTIISLEPHRSARFIDHNFDSMTYREHIKREIERYVQ